METVPAERLLANPGREWVWQDLEWLPEAARYEIVDGSLVVSPPPPTGHQYAGGALLHLLRNALPQALVPLAEAGVNLGRTTRIPDVLVTTRESVRRHRRGIVPPADVLLVVETLSPSSGTTDRVTKAHEYAAACIPAYWIVDLDDGPSITTCSGPGYREVTTVRGDVVLSITQPFEFSVRPSDLMP